MNIDIPLMSNNIDKHDAECLIEFLQKEDIFTQSKQVAQFEKEWCDWLGGKYSVFVNSGSSANLLTMAALKHLKGEGEVIVPTLTWVSDIASIIHTGLTPVFVDINPSNLAMNDDEVLAKINKDTRAVFLTHILGFNGLSERLLTELKERDIPLIEDVCESHGATFNNKKLGTFGIASNFSFYYAHHMTTIEGGMISTDDEEWYETVRMLRSHGMVREAVFDETKNRYAKDFSDLNPEFIFAYPGFNVRSTELNAVLGRSQLKRLDSNNELRRQNCDLFYKNLDSSKYWTDFNFDGSVNYAFVVVLSEKDDKRCMELMRRLKEVKVEFRRGTSGGGNQLRQPYLKKLIGEEAYKDFPVVDHVHFYGFYIGNYPSLEQEKIIALCELLNSI